jgi:hypothetical protein
MRALQLVSATTATPTADESEPELAEPEPGARDTTLEEATLVDGKKQKKDKKRKRRDVVENEQAAGAMVALHHTERGRRRRRSERKIENA